jgi:hypothetical protein
MYVLSITSLHFEILAHVSVYIFVTIHKLGPGELKIQNVICINVSVTANANSCNGSVTFYDQ